MTRSAIWIAVVGAVAGVAAAAWHLRRAPAAGIDPRVDRWDGEAAPEVDPDVAIAS